MVQSLSNWCYQTDPPDTARIARVLEVAKDLKVIMAMVNTDQFPFVIELAAFAAKRDFLNLDKWITDKMKAHQVRITRDLPVRINVKAWWVGVVWVEFNM